VLELPGLDSVCVYYCSTYYKAVRVGGGARIVEDMCCERRRAEVCVDQSAHHARVNAGEGDCVKEGRGREGESDSQSIFFLFFDHFTAQKIRNQKKIHGGFPFFTHT
jgi:hypothetical protein